MRSNELIYAKLEQALKYLCETETKLKPFIDKVTDIMLHKISEDEVTAKEAYEMFLGIQEYYTNSVLLITKIQEVIDYRE